MITIKLNNFGTDRPNQVQLQATTYKEALEGLKQHPEFNPKNVQDRFVCEIDGVQSAIELSENIRGSEIVINCKDRFKKQGRKFSGAGGDNAAVKIIVGIIIIVVAIYAPQILAGWGVSASTAASISTAMMATGIAFVVGGLAMLFAPEADDESNESTAVGRYPNTVEAGTPKALILGRHRWGGHLFGVNIESVQRQSAMLAGFTDMALRENALISNRDSWETLYYDPGAHISLLGFWLDSGYNVTGNPGENGGGSGVGGTTYWQR